jgi:hypothetical protein
MEEGKGLYSDAPQEAQETNPQSEYDAAELKARETFHSMCEIAKPNLLRSVWINEFYQAIADMRKIFVENSNK